MGILWEHSFWTFFFITVLIAGGAAYMTGRAQAAGWQPFWKAAFGALLLAAVSRFFHWGLFLDTPAEGTLLSLQYFATDFLVLLAIAWLGYRITRTRQMTGQYPWIYRKTSPLTWVQASQ
ncbi:MAG: DUF6867 family protein [Pseudomonadota bacterium]